MSRHFRPWTIDQTQLLPAAVVDYVPANHLARFVVALAREHLDVSEIVASYKSGLGQPPFDPRMMTALLLYAYCSGLYSSRRIAKACAERVAEIAAYRSTRAQVAGHSETPFSRLYIHYHRLSKHRWRSVNGTFGVASLIMGRAARWVRRWLPHVNAVGTFALMTVSRSARKCAYCQDHSRRPFVVFRISMTVGARVLLEVMGMEVAAKLDRSAIAPAA
jgi:hypothetical protein